MCTGATNCHALTDQMMSLEASPWAIHHPLSDSPVHECRTRFSVLSSDTVGVAKWPSGRVEMVWSCGMLYFTVLLCCSKGMLRNVSTSRQTKAHAIVHVLGFVVA